MAQRTAVDCGDGTEDSRRWWGWHRAHQSMVKMAERTAEDDGYST